MSRQSPLRLRTSPPRNTPRLPRECTNLMWTDLAWRCFYFWNLTTHHLDAIRFWHDDDNDDNEADHAPYVPSELIGERSERIQAMDARLQEVLGDAVEEDEDEDD